MSLMIRLSSLFSASFWSELTFSWVDSLIQKGEQKALTEEDVSDVTPACRSNNVDGVFSKFWKTEKCQSNHQPSLFRALFKSFGGLYLLAQCARFTQFLCAWNSPAILRHLIVHLEGSDTSITYGLALAMAFFFNQLAFSLFIEHSFTKCNLLGLNVRTALYTAIFKKSLSISAQSRQRYSAGVILSLVSEDASQTGQYINHLSTVLLSPLHVLVMFYNLFCLLGVSAVFGLVATVLLVPVNLTMTRRQERLEEKLLRKKDERMRLLTETLSGIKVVKLNAWEKCFGERLMSAREGELSVIRQMFSVRIPVLFSWTVAPYMISVLTFAAYVYMTDNVLDAQTAFVAITYLNILRYGINEASDVFFFIIKINLHLNRIKSFLLEEEHQTGKQNTGERHQDENAVVIKNGTLTWNNNSASTLKSIDLAIPRRSLTAVIGPVGSGKSSLISAILGEMKKTEGWIDVKGTIAYVPQQAWIQNLTLQNNVLFGGRYKKAWYETVMEACALSSDLDLLPGGDQAEIGERGVNLSGGQQQRVSLARAVYNDTDIYLLDDPLSAVDSHVSSHIFNNVIGSQGLLKNKTRILVTHNLSLLSLVDKVVVIKEGSIVQSGTFEQLMTSEEFFASVLKPFITDKDGETHAETSTDSLQTLRQRQHLLSGSPPVLSRIISDDDKEVGKINTEVYNQYLKALGVIPCLLTLTLYTLYHGVYMYGNIWLSHWTEDSVLRNTSSCRPTHGGCEGEAGDRWRRTRSYITVYTLLGVLQAVLIVTYSIAQGRILVTAARTLHKDLLLNVLRSPMSFFDTTPIGRITSRFSTDLSKLDTELAVTVDDCMSCMCNVIGGVFMICYVSPTALAIVVPMFFIFLKLRKRYMDTARQLKRLSAKSKAPMWSFFSEAVSGSQVIRAFRSRDTFRNTYNQKIDESTKIDFSSYLCDRWLGLRMSFLGNVILTSAIAMLCTGGGAVNGGSIGLTVSFSVEVGSELIWFIINSTHLDVHSISVERILQYTATPTETKCFGEIVSLPQNWPRQGSVEFRNVSLRYRYDLDLVLRGITFQVKPREKIAIVGRTGAGKSSLVASLFRTVELADGRIFVDDLDICRIGLQELRSKIAVIPQDPVLFTGSLRMNLDPESASSDTEIWTALQQTGLKEVVGNCPGQLMSECGEGGNNFSVGQRQLLCLTRTLLKKTRILVLDEATAAVDMATDDVIQNVIRREFMNCTVLTIAHRVRAIRGYDRVLVLDNGCIKEYDTPEQLLKNKSGIFYQLMHAGIK